MSTNAPLALAILLATSAEYEYIDAIESVLSAISFFPVDS